MAEPLPILMESSIQIAWDCLERTGELRDALRFFATPRGRRSSRFRRVVRLPFDSGLLDQSRDRREGPPADAQLFGCHHPNIATKRPAAEPVIIWPISIQYRTGVVSR